MASPYIGEIRMFGGNFPPNGWLFCEGQLLPILEYEALFQLIGTLYGGDGQSTFALPDLRGRIPIHQGTSLGLTPRTIGEFGGSESVLISVPQLPAHAHTQQGTGAEADRSNPKGALPARPREFVYGFPGNITPMADASTEQSGGTQPHSNMQPFLCVSFIISLYGIFPSQT